jgi:hypothetical protein
MNQFEHLKAVLERYAIDVKDKYQQNLASDNATASGVLINSVKYILDFRENIFEVSLSLADYWKYVEYGRKAGGKFPPPSAIRKWIEVKPILPRPMKNGNLPTLNQLTYLISRSIAEKGIRPRGILEKSLEEINREYEEKISEALTQDLSDEMDEVFALLITR